MRKAIQHVKVLLRAGVIILSLVTATTPVSAAAGDEIEVKRVEDSRSLPYRFEYLRRSLSPTGLPEIDQEDIALMNLDGDTIPDLCFIQHDWIPSDTQSAVIFTRLGVEGPTVDQVNLAVEYLDNWLVRDLDNDPYDELIVAYHRIDTIWLQTVDPVRGATDPLFLITGEDRDGDGSWAGWPDICGAIDITGDGIAEVLVATEVGYDLYSRQLICADVVNREILWRYEFSGAVGKRYFYVGPLESGGDTVLVFSVASKDNEVSVNGMDDQHAYVICLDLDGEELWRREVGERYLNPRLHVLDTDSDGDCELLCIHGPMTAGGEPFLASIDHTGQEVRKIAESRTGLLTDLRVFANHENIPRIVLTYATEKSMHVLSADGTLIQKTVFYRQPTVFEFDNFVGDERHEFLLVTADDYVWLLSEEFEPLAQQKGSLVRVGTATKPIWDQSGIPMTVVRDPTSQVANLFIFVRNPWFTIFFRNPLLAFFAGFIPLALIVILATMYLVTIRRKNRQISDANEELSATLRALRETQQKLIAAERYKQARDIAGGFAHEIRNALFPARTWLTRLRKEAACEKPSSTDAIAHVDSAIDRAVNMTNLISEYTRLEAMVDRSATPVRTCLQSVLDDYREQIESQGVKIEVGVPDSAYVAIGADHLYAVLRNLVANSLDALTDRKNPLISVGYSRSNGTVTVVFADNGSGIRSEHTSRVFDPFFTTKPSTGTGVGLSIAKRIVDIYGGQISLTSEPGQGAEFTLMLPAADGDSLDIESNDD